MKYSELHAHVEGTVPIKTLVALICKYPKPSHTLPDYFTDYYKEIINQMSSMIMKQSNRTDLETYLSDQLVLHSPTNKLIDFLKRLPSKFLRYYLRTNEDLKFVIETTLDQYGKDYEQIQLIFIPKSLENDWLTDDEIVQTFSQVWQNHPRKDIIRFVLSLRRTEADVSRDYCQKVVRDYSKYADKGISKIDICSDEDAVSYQELNESLRILSKAKQELTLHIGESSIRDMEFILDNFSSIKQFNHGIQGAYDKTVLEKLKQNDILLTLCPLSNIFTGVLTEDRVLEAIRILKENDVRYTVNSDDATIINGDVYAPYKYLLQRAPDLLVK